MHAGVAVARDYTVRSRHNIAPPLTGIIHSLGGSAAASWSITAVAVVGIVELCWALMRRNGPSEVVVENVHRRKYTAVEPMRVMGRAKEVHEES
jgi:hypothetical protein